MTAWNDADYYANPQVAQPFDPANVNPASYDLKLGNTLRRVHPVWERLTLHELRAMCSGEINLPLRLCHLLTDEEVQVYAMSDYNIDKLPKWGPEEQFDNAWLMPGEFVLCSSLEVVSVPDDCAAILLEKSSAGRGGLEHSHSGWVDAGWIGQLTWEFSNVAAWPIRLVAGKRYMQIVYLRLDAAPLRTYAETGRYQGQRGPTPARGER